MDPSGRFCGVCSSIFPTGYVQKHFTGRVDDASLQGPLRGLYGQPVMCTHACIGAHGNQLRLSLPMQPSRPFPSHSGLPSQRQRIGPPNEAVEKRKIGRVSYTSFVAASYAWLSDTFRMPWASVARSTFDARRLTAKRWISPFH